MRMYFVYATILVLMTGFFGQSFAELKKEYLSKSHDYVFQEIQKRKKIRIAVSKNYPPLGFQGKGVEFDMAKSLAKFLDVQVEMIPYEITNVIEAVVTRQVDIAIAGLSRSLPRAKRVWFSNSYLKVHPSALVKKQLLPQKNFGEFFEDYSIKSLSDISKLSGVRVLINENSIYEALFTSLDQIKFQGNENGLKMLLNNQGDILLYDSLYLTYLLKHNPSLQYKYKALIEKNDQESLCIALPFGDVILKNQVDIWISEKKSKNLFRNWVNIFFE